MPGSRIKSNQVACLLALIQWLVMDPVYAQKKEEMSHPMNILFIAVDDLRPSLGCYGDAKAVTPNIDQLAGRSMVFMNAYCQQAVCNPSRASMLTGLRPDQIQVTDLGTHFREKRPEVITLPQIFKEEGYQSVGIGKVFHGSAKAQDEPSWSEPVEYAISVKEEEYYLPKNRQGGKAVATESANADDEAYEDGKIAERGIEWLQKFKRTDAPFFLALGFKKPHLPFCAPQEYWDLYQRTDFSLLPNQNKPKEALGRAFHHWEELRGYADIPDQGSLAPEKEQELWHGYYACVSYVDAQIGRVLQTLAELGLEKNTIVVVWGDHGYHLGEQQLWAKATNFELDTRIPLLISVPGVTRTGAKTKAIVEAVDLYPTLISLCGIKAQQTLAGNDLSSLLENPDQPWEQVAFSQFARPYTALFNTPATHMGYTVRTPEWRYTAWFNLKTGTVDEQELYAMDTEMVEQKNLHGLPEFAEQEAQLREWVTEYKNGEYKKIAEATTGKKSQKQN